MPGTGASLRVHTSLLAGLREGEDEKLLQLLNVELGLK